MGRSQRASSHPRHSIPSQKNRTNPPMLPRSLIYQSLPQKERQSPIFGNALFPTSLLSLNLGNVYSGHTVWYSLSLSLRTLIILDCTVPGYTACHHRADDTIISKTSPMTNDMPTNVDHPMHTMGIIDVGQHSMRLSGENGIWWKTQPPQAPDHTFERDEDTSW